MAARFNLSYGSTKVGQFDLPGCEHEPSKLLLQRKADAPLKPGKPQEACDVGMFSDEANQLDLVDVARETAVMTRRSRFPGYRHMTGVQRRNARIQLCTAVASGPRRLASAGSVLPDSTPRPRGHGGSTGTTNGRLHHDQAIARAAAGRIPGDDHRR